MAEKESLLERFLYLLIALFINLILFGYLSLHLLIKGLGEWFSQTVILLAEDAPEVKEKPRRIERVVFGKDLRKTAQAPPQKVEKRSEGTGEKASAPIGAREGDVPIKPVEAHKEESILSELEKRVASRRAETAQGTAPVGDYLGEIKAEIGQSGVDLFKVGTRQVVHVPALPRIATTELPSTMQVRVWVEPSGRVSRVEIVKKSGVPEVDKVVAWFVRGIRFEPIKDNIIQTGVMTFRFKGG